MSQKRKLLLLPLLDPLDQKWWGSAACAFPSPSHDSNAFFMLEGHHFGSQHSSESYSWETVRYRLED